MTDARTDHLPPVTGPGGEIRSRYHVPAYINRRVTFNWHGAKHGTIVGFGLANTRLIVRFDGEDEAVRLHPVSNLIYEPNMLWVNRGGPGISGCDPRPTDVHRFRDVDGRHWSPIEPGGDWFHCEETDLGARYWTAILSRGPLGDAAVVDGVPLDPYRLRCGVAFIHRTESRLVMLTDIADDTVRYMRLDNRGEIPRSGRVRSGPRKRDTFARTYAVYRPCRWALECLAQATATIALSDTPGLGEVDACDEHAAEHRAWAAIPRNQRSNEPEPDCWCPDHMREFGDTVSYCPRCGSGTTRGTEVDPFKLAHDLPHFGELVTV